MPKVLKKVRKIVKVKEVKPKLVKCLNCNKQYFSVSRESLENNIHNLNVAYYRLCPAERKSIYGNIPFSMNEFLKCDECGNTYDHFIGIKEPKAHKNDVGFILDAGDE